MSVRGLLRELGGKPAGSHSARRSSLLLGWVMPFIFLFAIWKGSSHNAPYIARLAANAVAASLAITTLGNMLGDRGAGLGTGLLIALSLHGQRQSAKAGRRAHGSFRALNLPVQQTPLPVSTRNPEGI